MRDLGSHYIHGHSGFWGCSFCGGRGCLACSKQSDRKYREAFPEGPKPIWTAPINEPSDIDSQVRMIDEGCPHSTEPNALHADDEASLKVAVLGYVPASSTDALVAALREVLRR